MTPAVGDWVTVTAPDSDSGVSCILHDVRDSYEVVEVAANGVRVKTKILGLPEAFLFHSEVTVWTIIPQFPLN